MELKQMQTVESFRRVLDVAEAFPPPNAPKLFVEQVAVLTDATARLTRFAADQEAATRLARAGTQRKQEVRRELRVKHMAPIALVAGKLLRHLPGAREALAMPRGSQHAEALVAAARAMADAAAPHAQVFLDAGRPADFLEQLGAAAHALRDVIDERAAVIGRRNAATADIAHEIARGREAVSLLDAIMRGAFAGQPGPLARWRAAKRVVALGGARESAAPDATPDTTPVPNAA